MAQTQAKQLFLLDDAVVPLKDDDYLLVSLHSVLYDTNLSKKARVMDFTSKMQLSLQTLIDNIKYLMEQEFDVKYADSTNTYTKPEVDALLAIIDPAANYVSKAEAELTYINKYAYAEDKLLTNRAIEQKINITDANAAYEAKGTSYTKALVDSQIAALSNVYVQTTDVSSAVQLNEKFLYVDSTYAKISETSSATLISEKLNTLSTELTGLIQTTSPLVVKTIASGSTAFTAEDGQINYVEEYYADGIVITLPTANSTKARNFYIVINATDNQLANIALTFVRNGAKLYAEEGKDIMSISAGKVVMLHFMDINTNNALKVTRTDLILVAQDADPTPEPTQTPEQNTEETETP